MGVCTPLNCDAMSSHEHPFSKEDAKEGAASTQHCEQLLAIVTKHQNEALTQMQFDHFDPHVL